MYGGGDGKRMQRAFLRLFCYSGLFVWGECRKNLLSGLSGDARFAEGAAGAFNLCIANCSYDDDLYGGVFFMEGHYLSRQD